MKNRWIIILLSLISTCVQACGGSQGVSPNVQEAAPSLSAAGIEAQEGNGSGRVSVDEPAQNQTRKNKQIDDAFESFGQDLSAIIQSYPDFESVWHRIGLALPPAQENLKQVVDLAHAERNFFEHVLWKYIRNSKPKELGNHSLIQKLSETNPEREEIFSLICSSFQELMVQVSASFQSLRTRDAAAESSHAILCDYLKKHHFFRSITYTPTHNVTLRVLPDNDLLPRFPAPIEGIVVHYTACSAKRCIELFRTSPNEVSAHYLVDKDGNVVCFCDPALRTHHAGAGSWRGKNDVNARTIGIEIENRGYLEEEKMASYSSQDKENAQEISGDPRRWVSFTDKQLDTVRKMLQHFQAYYGIDPRNVIGHSDMAIGRKSDPGPLFPWSKFNKDYGIGAYAHDFDITQLPSEAKRLHNEPDKLSIDFAHADTVKWVQKNLEKYGYACPTSGELDIKTTEAIKAFQMHHSPNNISGEIDLQTIKALASLIEQHCK